MCVTFPSVISSWCEHGPSFLFMWYCDGLHGNAGTSSFVCGRDSFVEGVWLVPVVGLVSMLRALKILPFLRTLSILAGLGRLPGAVGVTAVLFEKNRCLPKCRLASCNERSGGDWMLLLCRRIMTSWWRSLIRSAWSEAGYAWCDRMIPFLGRLDP